MARRKSTVGDDTPDDVLAAIERGLIEELGGDNPGVVIRRMSSEDVKPFEAVPFGVPVLDKFLHGGIPVGRLTEIFGPESSGKSTICMHALAVMSQQGGVAMYVDAEHAFDAPYAQRIGVDISRVLIVQPDWGQQAFKLIHGFCTHLAVRRAGFDPLKPLSNKSDRRYPFETLPEPFTARACVLVDSVAALVPKAEYDRTEEGDFEGDQPAEQARMMSRQLRPLIRPIARGKVAALFTNQTRSKINVRFGSPETTPAGAALKFYASSRWRTGHRGMISSAGKVTPGQEASDDDVKAKVEGRYCSIQVVKCKLFNPFAPELVLPFTERGIDMSRVIFDGLTTLGIIEKNGAWYSIRKPGHRMDGLKWQGINGYFELVEKGGQEFLNELQAMSQTGPVTTVPTEPAAS